MSITTKPLSEGAWPTLVKHHSEYLATRKTELVTLQKALNNQTYKVLVDQAHNWRGSARPYNFLELEALAEKLEECAQNKEREGCEALLKEIEDYLGAEVE